MAAVLLLLSAGATNAFGGEGAAGGPPVEELTLANGMTFLLVERPGIPMTAAVWVAHTGSGDEQAGTTGVSHLLEHLLFRGSRTIGARDVRRELELFAREDAIAAELQDPGLDAAHRAELERRSQRLAEELRALQVKGEYALHYTRAGAVGINAVTHRDLTAYYLMLPAPRLELWFWMESDRLLAPMLRDFYAEYEIVEQERHQRIDSVPGRPEQLELERRFWGDDHPYSWPTIGRTEDLSWITRPVAEAYFRSRYRPDRLTAALVGDFDAAQVRRWADRYFGRLAPGSPVERQSRSGDEANGHSPRIRQVAACDCPTQIEILYPTQPFGHPEAVALDVLAGVLGGRTGRLHRGLVLERGIAFSASAQHAPLRRGGAFSVVAEARGSTTAEALEAAWLEELERLRREGVGGRELQKVKNRITTDAAREVKEPLQLALRLAVYDALGDWRQLYTFPERAQAVTAEDLERVIERYLGPERRATLLLERRSR
ncbi:MAG TPA: pitrilysin family protein [Thermoanaerobaculia bacterium]|nr:pitrilysin family protein [Thermoanaerobaculia bacterium]